MNDDQKRLLVEFREAKESGAFATACDGKWRDPANQLCAMGLSRWCGTNWGSSFYAITDAGLQAIQAEPAHA